MERRERELRERKSDSPGERYSEVIIDEKSLGIHNNNYISVHSFLSNEYPTLVTRSDSRKP